MKRIGYQPGQYEDYVILGHPNLLGSQANIDWADTTSIYGNSAFAAYPTANKAFYYPILVEAPVTISRFGYTTGSNATGNFDMGLYDFAGNRLTSSGSTGASGTGGGVNTVDVTDFTIYKPGLYFIGFAADNTTLNITRYSFPNAASRSRLWHMKEEASAFPLPATATFAVNTSSYLPVMIAIGSRAD